MTKEDPSGLLSKVVRFVKNPASWSELDQQEEERDSHYNKQALKEMIERKRRNDFVRRREFDQLRKLRKREALTPIADGQGRPSFFQSSLASRPDDRAVTLKKIDESLGVFSTMHSIPNLPEGESIKLEIPAHKTIAPKTQKFLQVRYASTASDGEPVFYELNLTADDTPPKVLSFGVHFPASDARSTARAIYFVRLISP